MSRGTASTTWCRVPMRAGDLLLVDALVVARVLERDRERAQLVVRLGLGERGDQARVEPAREVRADRDVRAQAQPHAVAQELLEVAVGRRRARPYSGVHHVRSSTILPRSQTTRPPGRHLTDAAERRARRARPPEREDLVDPGQIGLGRDLARGEQRLGLRAEHERAVVEQRVVERAGRRSGREPSVSRRRAGCHHANANWPFSRSSAATPSRSSSRSTTSVSQVVSRTRSPRARAPARSSGWL